MPVRLRFAPGLALCALLGCGAPGGESPAELEAATAAMVDTLAAISARVRADPMSSPFLNRERAALLAAMLPQQGGQQAMQTRYLLAQERVLAGDTRAAIADLEALVADARLTLDARSPQNKPFFDLLAIAYLRLGEQENCADNPSADMCILPLNDAARHVKEEGARKAIALYERMLRAFPDDYGSMWLYNIAQLAVGGYPARVSRAWLIPGISRPSNAKFPIFRNVAPAVGTGINGLSGGLSIADFDGDSRLDLFYTALGFSDAPHLLLGDGAGGFRDATAASGVAKLTGGLNNIHADYDNDGDEDILVLRGAWLGEAGRFPMSLLRNRGNGVFDDVTVAAGIDSRHPRHSAAWADFDLDGLLDLAVGNESAVANRGPSHPSELFHNNGDGTFTEVSRAVGLTLDAFVKGVTWGDVNDDGLPDLFASVLAGPNRLYMNRGGKSLKSWRFEEVSAAAGVQLPEMSFPTWFFDYDNDGRDDLLVLSYDIRNSGSLHEGVALEFLGKSLTVAGGRGGSINVEPSRLYRNKGDGTFEDVTRATGFETRAIYAMGANFGDLDNDGFLDFYAGTGNPDLRSIIPNRMFRNVDGKTFAEVTMEGGFAHIQKGHATAFADLDSDGDLDVAMELGGAYQGDIFRSVLFENPGWPGRQWVDLTLEGRVANNGANRSAIGAKVEVVAVNAAGVKRSIWRTVNTGGSFGAGPLDLHIGIGDATRIERVRIKWPDAARSVSDFTSIAPGKVYRVAQGGEPVEVKRTAVPFRKGTATDHEHPKP